MEDDGRSQFLSSGYLAATFCFGHLLLPAAPLSTLDLPSSEFEDGSAHHRRYATGRMKGVELKFVLDLRIAEGSEVSRPPPRCARKPFESSWLPKKSLILGDFVARPEGFEPPTLRSVV